MINITMDSIEFFKDRLLSVGDDALMDAKYVGLTPDEVIESYRIAGLPLPISLIPSHFTMEGFDSGWGNGYVKISSNHPSYGKHYDDIDVMVHGGVTYSEEVEGDFHGSEGYWIGFDTSHSGDTKQRWTKGLVLRETKELLKQLYRLK